MSVSKLIGFIIVLTLSVSCSEKLNYQYFKGLNKYMSDTFEINLENEEGNLIYYFLPVDNCSSCQQTNLNLNILENVDLKENLRIVFIVNGNLDSSDIRRIKDIGTRDINTYYDWEGTVYNYRTGILKPLLVHLQDGKLVYFLNVNDTQIFEMREYISK